MKAKAFQIHWHNKQPIYSVDFHPQNSNKLATCGGDNNIWNVVHSSNESASISGANYVVPFGNSSSTGLRVEYLATLTKHMKSVNCVRFSPSGEYLASAGDGGFVILWKQSEIAPLQYNKAFGEDSEDEEDTDRKEYWSAIHQFRAMDGEDIYDLSWSPDGKSLILGLTDNTAQIWDTLQGKCIKVLKDHQHFVQGVAWDPLDQFLVTQSSDRSAKIWLMRPNSKGSSNFYSLTKYSKLTSIANNSENLDDASVSYSMFHDETLVSFFRRPNFSPDGSLLCLPTGQRTPLTPKNTPHGIYLNLRNNLHKPPSVFIGGFEKAAIATRFNPKLFTLIPNGLKSYIDLPYRMIFSVVTQNSVYIFDTQNKAPLFMFSNFHYASLTDVAWSADGSNLVASSVDGFCTVAEFDLKNDFGSEILSLEESEKLLKNSDKLVKGIPFFNPPKKKHQQNGVILQNLSVPMSSEIDIIIEREEEDDMDVDVDVDSGGINLELETKMSTDIGINGNVEIENKEPLQSNPIATKSKSVPSSPQIIHNPPVKRRISPTLISKD